VNATRLARNKAVAGVSVTWSFFAMMAIVHRGAVAAAIAVGHDLHHGPLFEGLYP
jgi:hypothetical protein